jgi:hypothetical protein
MKKVELRQLIREEIQKNVIPKKLYHLSDVISSKNMWLEKLKKDLLQNKYNLKKVGLYNGLIKEGIENLLESLKDYDV